jgi:hypothetical protein
VDLGLDVVNCVNGLNIESDGLSSQCLDENLHTSMKTQNKVQGRLLLNVVITPRSAIFKLLSGKDETLLVRGGIPPLSSNALDKK